MADEADKIKEVKKPGEDDQEKAPTKGGLIKYIVFGLAGLVAIVAVAFGALLIVGGNSASDAPTEESAEATERNDGGAEEPGGKTADGTGEQPQMPNEDSLLAFLEQDESVLETIMANLEALDYVPGEEDLADEKIGMTVEDSIEAANWLENEKAKLAERETDLDAKEKRLNVLDSKVSQKILRIEQAESARISKLAKLYDGMEARAVAKLVANLDDATVVSLLPRMKLKNASSVLALMPPVRAARLSKQMITIAED